MDSNQSSNVAMARRYGEIPYDALPHRATHPGRLATIAQLAGHVASNVDRCNVLEVGCNNGANLISMAVSLPNARFVGCDLSPGAIAEGTRTIEALGLANVTLIEADLTSLHTDHGAFDFIVAHGIYSWVSMEVRDALLALANARLAPEGIMYVSYNVLPGCRVRQAVWDALHQQVDHLPDARERLDAARRFARLAAEGSNASSEADQAVRAEFRAVAQRSDSELCHDDLAIPNEPVLFDSFVRHAARHHLSYLADAEFATTGTEGLPTEALAFVGALEPLAREQAIDSLRLRRFRQSLLVRRHVPERQSAVPRDHRAMYASATWELARVAAAGEMHKLTRKLDPASGGGGVLRKLLEELAAKQPEALGISTLTERFDTRLLSRPLQSMLLDAYRWGFIDLHVQPPRVESQSGGRPLASPLARLQAQSGDQLTSLLHMSVSMADPNALRLLPLVDGTRDHASLALAVRQLRLPIDASRAEQFVGYALQKFARLGLLMPQDITSADSV